MSIYISIVSHNHSELINKLGCVLDLSTDFNICIKSNTPYDSFNTLEKIDHVHWIQDKYFKGFGANNNYIFDYCTNQMSMKDDDYFIVLNPDVIINKENIEHLILLMEDEKTDIAAINLYKDKLYNVYDNSIRRFPNLFQFIKSFLGFGNNSAFDKDKIIFPTKVDWAAGSFIAFKAQHYKDLQGFDEGYFMYCEDIDICFRSQKMNKPIIYFPLIKAIHMANHNNRKLFSKHFLWHVSSVVRFLLVKHGFINKKIV
jgi:GT2 family glycosyltransferase